MRLFVGIDIPEEIAARAEATIGTLRRTAPDLRWSPTANLHITTKFIGSWPEGRLDELRQALARIAVPPFDIELKNLGWFPNPHSPRIFWVGADGGDALRALAQATDEAAAALGVAREDKPYRPHLTLARVKPSADIRQLRGAVAALDSQCFGSWTVAAFHLYLSQSGPAGSVYTKLAGFPIR